MCHDKPQTGLFYNNLLIPPSEKGRNRMLNNRSPQIYAKMNSLMKKQCLKQYFKNMFRQDFKQNFKEDFEKDFRQHF